MIISSRPWVKIWGFRLLLKLELHIGSITNTFLSQVLALYDKVGYVPKDAKEDYMTAWTLKSLYGYAWRNTYMFYT